MTKEARLLMDHGTKAYELSPAALITTAREDIRRRERNIRVRAERKEMLKEFGRQYVREHGEASSPTGFLLRHVKTAKSPADVLRAALKEVIKGQTSKRIDTRRLYQNPYTLHAALMLAENG